MAINIFSGSSGKAKVNAASQSTRAQAAKAALSAPSETSNSGSTAVKTGGTLGKVGDLVGKVAGIASKFLPGVGGTIASGIASLLNDPEWWQSVPGNAVTLNSPLRAIELGETDGHRFFSLRPAIADFTSAEYTDVAPTVIAPSEQAITQYLMPQIRKVVNAIPLQTAAEYSEVIKVNATIYAMWRQLKKVDYMLKHGQTYLANMNDSMFPLFQVENASFLQATINRLEEYLRANVRLPHTMCEYLAWRFGRVYKSNDSAKAGLIMYNVLDLATTIDRWKAVTGALMSKISSTAALQAANTDIYNAYYDHDFMVEIKDETQFTFDCKEFMLRTNADVAPNDTDNPYADMKKNRVCIDSRLDNPTTFMASTVSTIGLDDVNERSLLFPIAELRVYIPQFLGLSDYEATGSDGRRTLEWVSAGTGSQTLIFATRENSNWVSARIRPSGTYYDAEEPEYAGMMQFILNVMLTRPLDIYNKSAFLTVTSEENEANIHYDITSLSVDMGIIDQTVLGIEHVFAFANLVDIDRKTSMSYAKAEKLVARDTANFVEKLDVATAATPVK